MKIKIGDLHDFNKITEYVNRGHIKVQTKNGPKQIENIGITAKDSIKLNIITKSFNVSVSPDHLLYKYDWIESEKLVVGDCIDTVNGYEGIISIEKDCNLEDLYDIQVDGNEFYANGIRSHNSSFQEAFDFSLFGIVRGKERKRVAVKYLPNRINKHLYSGINFVNEQNQDIFIKRHVAPAKLEIIKNGKDITKKFKVYSDKEKDDFIGFNYEVYKSFISLNMNDFLNFINLDTDTKRKLLDRLFNIGELDEYQSITKRILKTLDRNKSLIETQIDSDIRVIGKYKENLTVEDIDDYKSKGDIKQDILKKKGTYLSSKQELKNSYGKIKEISNNIKNKEGVLNNKNNQIVKENIELKHINKKLGVFKRGKCPICKSILKDDCHHKEMENVINEKNIIEDSILKIKDECEDLKIEIEDLNSDRSDETKIKNELVTEFGDIEDVLRGLKYKYDNFKGDVYKNEIIDNISKIEIEIDKHKKSLEDINSKIIRYNRMLDIVSENGIRKDIITDVVKPINKHLNQYLKKLESPFKVKLNNEFDAIVYERMINEVPSETLSSGEARKINIAIALAYMEIIFSIRKSNVLFIDEVFANIDEINVGILLQVFKDFAKEHRINIIIINQYFMDVNIFDRVIQIEKNYFSDIVDTRN